MNRDRRNAGSSGLAGGAKYAALAEQVQVLQSAGPVQRGRLDIGLGRADSVDRARAGMRDDSGLGLRTAAQRPACGAHDRDRTDAPRRQASWAPLALIIRPAVKTPWPRAGVQRASGDATQRQFTSARSGRHTSQIAVSGFLTDFAFLASSAAWAVVMRVWLVRACQQSRR